MLGGGGGGLIVQKGWERSVQSKYNKYEDKADLSIAKKTACSWAPLPLQFVWDGNLYVDSITLSLKFVLRTKDNKSNLPRKNLQFQNRRRHISTIYTMSPAK